MLSPYTCVVMAALTATVLPGHCPDHWRQWYGYCYRPKVLVDKDYRQSEAYCNSVNGDLMQPETRTENNFIRATVLGSGENFLRMRRDNPAHKWRYEYRAGQIKNASFFNWKWETTPGPTWGDCVKVDSRDQLWSATDCNSRVNRIICQLKKPNLTTVPSESSTSAIVATTTTTTVTSTPHVTTDSATTPTVTTAPLVTTKTPVATSATAESSGVAVTSTSLPDPAATSATAESSGVAVTSTSLPECPDGTFGMNCTKLCHCSDTCDKVTGSCLSSCLPGWKGQNCQKQDCSYKGYCGIHTCHERDDGFYCDCLDGYHHLAHRHCQDIDECEEDDECGFHTCRNTNGSYDCVCHNESYENVHHQLCVRVMFTHPDTLDLHSFPLQDITAVFFVQFLSSIVILFILLNGILCAGTVVRVIGRFFTTEPFVHEPYACPYNSRVCMAEIVLVRAYELRESPSTPQRKSTKNRRINFSLSSSVDIAQESERESIEYDNIDTAKLYELRDNSIGRRRNGSTSSSVDLRQTSKRKSTKNSDTVTPGTFELRDNSIGRKINNSASSASSASSSVAMRQASQRKSTKYSNTVTTRSFELRDNSIGRRIFRSASSRVGMRQASQRKSTRDSNTVTTRSFDLRDNSIGRRINSDSSSVDIPQEYNNMFRYM